MAGIEKLPTERTGMELPWLPWSSACPQADDLPPVPLYPILPQIHLLSDSFAFDHRRIYKQRKVETFAGLA